MNQTMTPGARAFEAIKNATGLDLAAVPVVREGTSIELSMPLRDGLVRAPQPTLELNMRILLTPEQYRAIFDAWVGDHG